MARVTRTRVIVAAALFLVCAGTIVIVGALSVDYSWGTWREKDIVVDPTSGQPVLVNELVILGGSSEEVTDAVRRLGGRITVAVPETESYQARFPVHNLTELDTIADQLKGGGFQAIYVILVGPATPGLPQ